MLLLTNGTIATMDPARPMAEAAVVDGAYFAYVGGRADAEDFARRFSRGAWETLDLQGRFVMPGFNDSHLHFIHYVKTKLSVNLFGCTSLAEVQERLRRGAGRAGGRLRPLASGRGVEPGAVHRRAAFSHPPGAGSGEYGVPHPDPALLLPRGGRSIPGLWSCCTSTGTRWGTTAPLPRWTRPERPTAW